MTKKGGSCGRLPIKNINDKKPPDKPEAIFWIGVNSVFQCVSLGFPEPNPRLNNIVVDSLAQHKETATNTRHQTTAGTYVASAKLAASPAEPGRVTDRNKMTNGLITDSTKQIKAMSI